MSKIAMIGTRVTFGRVSILHPVSPEKKSMEAKEALGNGW